VGYKDVHKRGQITTAKGPVLRGGDGEVPIGGHGVARDQAQDGEGMLHSVTRTIMPLQKILRLDLGSKMRMYWSSRAILIKVMEKGYTAQKM